MLLDQNLSRYSVISSNDATNISVVNYKMHCLDNILVDKNGVCLTHRTLWPSDRVGPEVHGILENY